MSLLMWGPSVDVPEVDDLALLLEKIVGCIQDVGSVDSRLIETWVLYGDELTALNFSVPIYTPCGY